MGEPGVIRDTTASVRDLLRAEVRSSSGREVSVHTGTLDSAEIVRSLPCLSLFLYRIEENRELYRPEKVLEPVTPPVSPGDAFYRKAPLYLTIRLAVLAWAETPGDEHLLLGQVLRTLMDHPQLEAGRGLVGDSFRDGDRVSLRLTHPFGLADQQAILGSLGIPLRPILSCSATVRLDSAVREFVRRVRRATTRVEEVNR